MDQERLKETDGMDPRDVATFESARPALSGMAYRMLGSFADAEDVVHDVYMRWAAADRLKIQNGAGWLMTVCTRRCIDILRSAARSRTTYVGPWLPEPLAQGTIDEPHELSAALETAFLLLLERVSAKERAAFLLNEVFGTPHSEVGVILGVSELASRKLASRARMHVQGGVTRHRLEPERQRHLLGLFEQAVKTDDLRALSEALADDVRLEADAGGKVQSVDHPLVGRTDILTFLHQASEWWRDYKWESTDLAEGCAILLLDEDIPVAAIWFGSADGASISNVYIMRNPGKLRSLAEARKMRR